MQVQVALLVLLELYNNISAIRMQLSAFED